MRRLVALVGLLASVVAPVGLAAPATAEGAARGVTFTVTTTKDLPDANRGDGVCQTVDQTCSLRAALYEVYRGSQLASEAVKPGEDQPAPFPATIVLPSGTLDVSGATFDATTGAPGARQETMQVWGAVTVTGAGRDATILDAGTTPRAFEVIAGSLVATGLTLKGGRAPIAGGALLSLQGADLALRAVTISDAGADGDGGAVVMGGGTLTLDDVELRDNAARNGGAIAAARAAVRITKSRFAGNGASGSGGSLFLSYPTDVAIDAATSFADGHASVDGGAIAMEGATGPAKQAFELAASFTGNTASGRGGALFVDGTSNGLTDRTLHLAKATFTENDGAAGGAVAMADGALSVDGSTFSKNRATTRMGGAILSAGSLVVRGSTFADGSAVGPGGAIASTGLATIDSSTFTGNHSDSLGGALSLEGTAAPIVHGSTFGKNTADSGGGAIWRGGRGLDQADLRLTANEPAGDDVALSTYDAKLVGDGGPSSSSDGSTSKVVLHRVSLPLVGAVAAGFVVLLVVAFLLLRRRRRPARSSTTGGPS